MNTTNENGLLSIGGLARACDIPVETLRNWERRYDFPSPARRESGHRRYPTELVPRLRLIRAAIEQGYKSSFAVTAAPHEIEALLREHGNRQVDEMAILPLSSTSKVLDHWQQCAAKMDGAALALNLRRAWSVHSADFFINQLVIPFLREIGERWSADRLSVGQEHLVSETIQNFLQSEWRPLANAATGPRLVLANLEGEHHCLGLHMAALFLALNGFEVSFLGPNTPLRDLVDVAITRNAKAVIVGLSEVSPKELTASTLTTLRQELPRGITIVAGGTADAPNVPDIQFMATIEEFAKWTLTFARTTQIGP